ncbi:3-hydroxyacyl-[acyl-carrier-protein] dehydratase [Mucilaginibacter gossypiicola]|uniref:3-hydroxyacyl-[acyl-carrier-protein] dehydratase n=1 Tax=Mucilaginibacter gossypiicola TaxID=551995 RepID=A0A1H8V327_9SPHI|nr:MaoC/PaaZ C-terminal domain-containing protein [Mucilaginibacter gossypiicola]SEP09892.1 3-hydroxyacyl-[acyl-carrier-protein] dehydratase [Mucilaginibacter gossypiicola]
MLKDTFFTFSPPEIDGSLLKTTITLNPAHDIFKGHFPGNPIVPGVCMMQMIKEVLEDHLDKKLQLVKADNIKFLSFVNPNQHLQVRLEVKLGMVEEQVKIDAQLVNEGIVFLKFKGVFK